MIDVGCTTGKLNKIVFELKYVYRQYNVTSKNLAEDLITKKCKFGNHLKVPIMKKNIQNLLIFFTLKTHEDSYISELLNSRSGRMKRMTGEINKLYTKLFD